MPNATISSAYKSLASTAPLAGGADESTPLNQDVIKPDTSSFREALSKTKTNPAQHFSFDGGVAASAYENQMRQNMQALNGGAMSEIVGLDIDKEFKFLTDLLIEEYKDPDPSAERDHTDSTRTIVALIGAANQAKSAQLIDENNKLMTQQMRLSTEGRIGRRVQYRGSFIEVRPEDTQSPMFYRLGKKAAKGAVTIFNKEGEEVASLPLTDLEKGDYQINWNLKNKMKEDVDPGLYIIEFKAFDDQGNPIPHILEVEGIISRIDTNEKREPVYYVGDVPIDGRVTRVGSLASDWQVATMRDTLSRLEGNMGTIAGHLNAHASDAITPPLDELAQHVIAVEG